MDHELLLAKAIARRTDPLVTGRTKLASSDYASDLPTSIRYAVMSMQMMDPAHTEISLREGARVRNHIEKELPGDIDYRFQGSVINRTDIRSHSDIDLLCITKAFYYLAPGQKTAYPWTGNPAKHLKDQRDASAKRLDTSFPAASVSDGSKSISITGGSLARKVDIVAAAWNNTLDYLNTNDETYRAIKILDSSGQANNGWGDLPQNQPFLHNKLLDERDAETCGSFRKAARLMKCLKYDESINISSFDIVAIAYRMDTATLINCSSNQLMIVAVCCEFCRHLLDATALRESLMVPDQSRRIFKPEGLTSTSDLEKLWQALRTLQDRIIAESTDSIQRRSIEKFAAARRLEESYPDYSILNSRDF